MSRRVGDDNVTIQARDALNGTLVLDSVLFNARSIPGIRAASRALAAQRFDSTELERALAFEVGTTFLAVLSAERLHEAAARRGEGATRTPEEARIRPAFRRDQQRPLRLAQQAHPHRLVQIADQPRCARQPAANRHHISADHVHHHCQGPRHQLAPRRDRPARLGLSGHPAGDDRLRAQEFRRPLAVQPLQPPGRTHGIHAAQLPAAALESVFAADHRPVAPFTGISPRARHQLPVDHQPAADARAKDHPQHRAMPPACALQC